MLSEKLDWKTIASNASIKFIDTSVRAGISFLEHATGLNKLQSNLPLKSIFGRLISSGTLQKLAPLIPMAKSIGTILITKAQSQPATRFCNPRGRQNRR